MTQAIAPHGGGEPDPRQFMQMLDGALSTADFRRAEELRFCGSLLEAMPNVSFELVPPLEERIAQVLRANRVHSDTTNSWMN